MKKLLLGSVALLSLAAVPALADHHGEGKMEGKMEGKHMNPEMMHDKMFGKHDANGDGVVSKEEFLAHAEEKFNKMDADGDGNMTKDESKAYHEAKRAEWKEKHDKMKEMKEEMPAE